MIHIHITTNELKETKPGANLQQQGEKKGTKKKERACYMCDKKDCLEPTCPKQWDPKEKQSNPDKYKEYLGRPNTGTTVNQTRSVTPSDSKGSVPLQLNVPNQQGSTGT